MPVTAKLSRSFYDRLGDNLANELVEWFNQVDATYRGDLRQLNELNFSRFDASVGERFAVSELKFMELERRMDGRMTAFEARMDLRMTEFEARMDLRMTGFEARIETRMTDFEARIETRMTDFEARIETRMTDFEARIETRMSALEVRMTALEARMTALEARMTALEARLEKRLSEVELALHHRFDVLQWRMFGLLAVQFALIAGLYLK
jgi:hypothetical protein